MSLRWASWRCSSTPLEEDGEVLAGKLAGFSATLVADAESRLNRIYAELDVLEAGCNAHGRRKFRNAEGAQPELAAAGGQFIAALYVQERLAKEEGLTGDALLAFRLEHMAPLVADFRQWLDVLLPKLLPCDPLAKAVGYYNNHWTALTRFLTDPALPLDNNLSERLLRPLALGRNHWMSPAAPSARTAPWSSWVSSPPVDEPRSTPWPTWLGRSTDSVHIESGKAIRPLARRPQPSSGRPNSSVMAVFVGGSFMDPEVFSGSASGVRASLIA